MNNLLIPFYNNLPNTDTPCFNITSSKLIISPKDIFGNVSNQLSNKTIYIYNGRNMGTIKINSLIFTTPLLYTYSINTNYIPSITENELCVLSINPPPSYMINRTYTTSINNLNKNGYFTILDDNNILINKKSLSDDDTLFLYILATNPSFNIVNNITGSSYLITNVTINLYNSTNDYIQFNANIPQLSLTNGYTYNINIEELNNSTPTFTSTVENSNNINFQSNEPPYDSVILKYTTIKNFTGSGTFTIQPLIDSFTNVPKQIEHFDTSVWLNSIKNGISKIGSFAQNSVVQLAQNTIKPDLLYNIPIFDGNNYKFSLSTLALFNKNIDFLSQNSLMYLSNGSITSLISIDTIPISKNNDIIECNILYSGTLSNLSNTSSYVLSSLPITPYIVYNYVPSHDISKIIDVGTFSILAIDSNHPNPTMIISNFEIIYNNNITSFTNLLYTISQDPVECLNILNYSDYSPICSISILNVVPDSNQTTITYTVKSGASNLDKLSSSSRYIFSLYSSTDFTSDNANNQVDTNHVDTNHVGTNIGILNMTQLMDKQLTTMNNLIQGAYNSINSAYLIKPNDSNLIIANNIITHTSFQSNVILNMPVTPITPTIVNALLTNTYNAILYALKYDSNNPTFKLIITSINNINTKPIQLAILNNAATNIQNAINLSPDISSLSSIHEQISMIKYNLANYVNPSFTNQVSTSNIDISVLNNIISSISIIMLSNQTKTQTNFYLIKAQKILQLIITPGSTEIMQNVTKGKLIENLDNVVQDNSHYQFIFSMIIFVILIGFLINNSRK